MLRFGASIRMIDSSTSRAQQSCKCQLQRAVRSSHQPQQKAHPQCIHAAQDAVITVYKTDKHDGF